MSITSPAKRRMIRRRPSVERLLPLSTATTLSFNEKLPIIPGMTAEVDILTGKKTVMSYLLKPVLRAKANALSER